MPLVSNVLAKGAVGRTVIDAQSAKKVRREKEV
jgi:hypothetical protein